MVSVLKNFLFLKLRLTSSWAMCRKVPWFTPLVMSVMCCANIYNVQPTHSGRRRRLVYGE